MAEIREIVAIERGPEAIIKSLKKKTIVLPPWEELHKEYDSKLHPVMTDKSYRDIHKKGSIEKVTRIPLDLQKLAVKRMTELAFGIPVKRIYKAESEEQKRVAKIMEAIMQRNRIDSLNIERGNMLFASCEVVTIWYALEQKNNLYGEEAHLKLRSKNYSPIKGDRLYPLFDEYDDLIALSIEYSRKEEDVNTTYFETFTANEHIRWSNAIGKGWSEELREPITLEKIPGIYIQRPTPIWEGCSNIVYEIEWTLSRNGNYIRKNSKPVYAIFSDEDVKVGGEKSGDNEFRAIQRYPANAKAEYITWPQSTQSLELQINNLYRAFFTQLQLPDMSFDNMKATPMSGEARKQMFIDAHLKVKDESGRILEALDREINVVKAFMCAMYPTLREAIDSLQVELVITPFVINDEGEAINNLTAATGGKSIMTRREAIRQLGFADDVDAEYAALIEEEEESVFKSSAF